MNDFCNCGCGFNPGSDYNAFGDIGYNLPLIYEVYCKTIQEVNGTDPDTQDKIIKFMSRMEYYTFLIVIMQVSNPQIH